MSARIRTSEASYRPPVSQWQAERARGELQPFPGNRTIRGFYVPWWAWGTLFPAASLALHFAGAF